MAILYIEKCTSLCYNIDNEKGVIIRNPPKEGDSVSASTAIKDRLKDMNMTQIELANALGTTRQNLANKMARDNFSTKELCQIGEILNFSLVLKADKEYVIEYSRG